MSRDSYSELAMKALGSLAVAERDILTPLG